MRLFAVYIAILGSIIIFLFKFNNNMMLHCEAMSSILSTYITVVTFLTGFLIAYLGFCMTACSERFIERLKNKYIYEKIVDDAYKSTLSLVFSIFTSLLSFFLLSFKFFEYRLLTIFCIISVFLACYGFTLFIQLFRSGYLCYKISGKEEKLRMGSPIKNNEDDN